MPQSARTVQNASPRATPWSCPRTDWVPPSRKSRWGIASPSVAPPVPSSVIPRAPPIGCRQRPLRRAAPSAAAEAFVPSTTNPSAWSRHDALPAGPASATRASPAQPSTTDGFGRNRPFPPVMSLKNDSASVATLPCLSAAMPRSSSARRPTERSCVSEAPVAR